MKRIYFAKPACLILLFFLAIPPVPEASGAVNNRVTQLEHRLAEIKAIDKEALTRAEKRQLRKEVREIRKELAAISGGVYLSVGALILIALLLILLL